MLGSTVSGLFIPHRPIPRWARNTKNAKKR